MDPLLCASLSHTHYWYEVDMLKVPAIYIIIVHAGYFEMFQAAVLERYLAFSPTFRSEAFSTLSPVESRLQRERLH